MRLLAFLQAESSQSYLEVVSMATVSGLANGMLLAIVNHAAHIVANNEDMTQYFLLYVTAFALFIYSQWFAFDRAILLVEEALYSVRNRLSGKIRGLGLAFVERYGTDNLYARMTQNDTFLSQAIPQITMAAQLTVLMSFSLLYLAVISPLTFVITLVTLGSAASLFHAQSRVIREGLDAARAKEAVYFRSIADMIHGFKEVKSNRRRSDDILRAIAGAAQQSKSIKIRAGRQEARMFGFGRVFIYALLPLLVFVLPSFSVEQAADVYKITATMLFITGPITIWVNTIPLVNRVDMVLEEMQKLEAEMDAASAEYPRGDSRIPRELQSIRVVDLQFRYPAAESGFVVGPCDEEIRKGELLFVVGGNGSGKTTFLKLLTGFYEPQSGRIEVDSQELAASDYADYRELFSVVFMDFHLFEKIYGIADLEGDKVDFWLRKVRLADQVQFRDGGFTSTKLSTGQRKRLALVAAMLEERPILVLDEFAADQDPQFRQYFYETLLGEIRATGKTVIAVTHDDHYFHVADRVLKMDDGKMVPYAS